jgi:peptide deformylase
MAVRRVLTLPKYEKVLRRKSQPVKSVDRSVRNLIRDLRDTLDTQEGVGLAAPQIGVLQRVCLVMRGTDQQGETEDGTEPEVIALINPEVIEESDEAERDYDGCLSIPGLQGYTHRPATLRVRALDESGDTVEYQFEGFDARVAAHELDHLDGILFLDRLSSLEELFYLVPDPEDDEKIKLLPYLEVHPEYRLMPTDRVGMPTRGVETIMG